MLVRLKRVFTGKRPKERTDDKLKYLIVGLGNIGPEYAETRHNVGFKVLDALAEASNTVFSHKRYGAVAEAKYRGRTLILLKPATYMNLSGNAVRYWVEKEKIQPDNMLVVVDDLALPLGTIRLRAKGGDGGHNGLRHINQILGRNNYPRLRFGIGDDFSRGQQVDYVLSEWSDEERHVLPNKMADAVKAVQSFTTIGLERTMNLYNN